jgi:ADP-ribose pyrophosphatase
MAKNSFAGMTNANMQLAVLNVDLEDKMETPTPKLEVGEHIVTRVVELSRLKDELEGTLSIHLTHNG